MPWGITEEEERASFEVLRVADLPPVERDDIPVVPHSSRPCGCYWCDANWPTIARVAVEALETGIDPFDDEEIARRAQAAGLSSEDVGWLFTLFNPSQSIMVLRNGGQFTNGMHRTHALRMHGVERCVVYTGKGERPYEDEDADPT